MIQDPADLVAVIMAGGAGTRFWPLSTAERPKQFLKLFDERSLLQESLARLSGIVPVDRVLVLTHESLVSLVREQLPEIPAHNIIGEPLRRDTAAAVGLAALICRKRYGNPVVLTVTADHVIEPLALFQQTALSACREAQRTGALYTFGVSPDYPATCYGYLELGEQLVCDEEVEHFRLTGFHEKPELERARQYLASNRYCWNSGMFVWSAEAILGEMTCHLPDHLSALSEAIPFDQTEKWPDALRRAFDPLPRNSIDYAVMEKAGDVRCVVARFRWIDVGGWMALSEFLPRDEAANAFRCQLHTLEATGNIVYCDDAAETVVLVGVQDLVVVRAGERTLIVPKERAEEVKRVVQTLPQPR